MGPGDMDTFLILLLFAGVGLVLFAALVLVIATAIRIARGGKQRGSGNAEEARLMQEIYLGLERLNDRVESLETIVLDQREETKSL